MRAAAHTPAYTTPNLHHHELQFLLCGEHTSDSSLLWLANQHPAPLRVRDTATPAAACTAGLETRTRSSLAITRTGISRPSMMVISSLVPYIYVQLLQVFIPLIYDTKVQIQSCIVTRLLVFIHECLSAYRDNEYLSFDPGSCVDEDGEDDHVHDERRGEGQDGDEDSGPSPRPALRPGLCLHRARGQGTEEGAASLRPGCSPVRSQFPEERKDDGALRRTPGSRGPQQPVEAAREEAPPPLQQRRAGRGTAPG